MKDDLSNLLREWQPEITEPTDFRRNVWCRIAAADASKPSSFENLLVLISRPKIALAMAAITVSVGITVGTGAAESGNATAYFRSVNPYAQVAMLR